MLCRRFRAWISLSLDGALPPDRTVALTAHLERCGSCRTYQEDLQVGRRLLAATRPRPAPNFEWRLQLKMNRALQEAARAASSPLAEPRPGAARWMGMAGAAMAAGVVLTLVAAHWLLPTLPAGAGRPAVVASRSAAAWPPLAGEAPEIAAAPTLAASPQGEGGAGVGETAGDASRTSYLGGTPSLLWRGEATRGMLGRPAGITESKGWSGISIEDLRTITTLREDNRRLRAQLSVSQRQVEMLRAQLDSASARALSDTTSP